MSRMPAHLIAIVAALGVAVLLPGCTESRLREADDFGQAVRQDVAAQVADPAAHYAGVPDPGADGERTAGAMLRYAHGKVTPPPTITTSTISQTGGGGGGSGGQ